MARRRPLAAALLAGAAAALAEDVCAAGAGGCGGAAYAWPQRGGNSLGNGAAPYAGPSLLPESPTWTWPNPEDECMRFGPLIDDRGNVYLLTINGWVRKFDSEGRSLWSWRTSHQEGKLATPGALYQGNLYFASFGFGGETSRGYLFSFDMEMGELNWRTHLPRGSTYYHLSSGLVVEDGVILTALRDHVNHPSNSRNNKILALSTEDGRLLWDFRLEPGAVVHDFRPAFPGDGTLLFSTPSARAYRLRLGDGAVLWKAGFEEPGEESGSGGGSLGPGGDVFYASGSYFQQVAEGAAALSMLAAAPTESLEPCSEASCHMGPGVVVAYRVEDGAILWQRRFEPGLSGTAYPAVGRIAGAGTSPLVIVGLGENAGHARYLGGPEDWWPSLRMLASLLHFAGPWVRRRLLQVKERRNAIWALNASNGHEVWRFEDAPWDYFAAEGDGEGWSGRFRAVLAGSKRKEVECQPGSWGSPTIGADGTVYAASGLRGVLHALKDRDGDGIVAPAEVSSFATGQAFASGVALGPSGRAFAAPCWGPLLALGGSAGA